MSIESTQLISVFDHLEAVHTEQTINRMFHLDAGRRYKIRGLMECTAPAVFDCWRHRYDMQGLIARGVWPFVSYADVQAGTTPLAAGEIGQITASIGGGRIAKGLHGEGALLMGTRIDVLAQPGGDDARNFMDTAGSGELVAGGRAAIVWAMVQPFAAPEERVLRELPPELEGVSVHPCEPLPSVSALMDLGDGFQQRGHELRRQRLWPLHHTDANQIVLTTQYMLDAEDLTAEVAASSDLSLASMRVTRMRVLFKAPFAAAQPCELRASLHVGEPGGATVLVGFHSLGADGQPDPRPAILARVDIEV